MAQKSWSELSASQQRTLVVVGAVEVVLTVAALRDLASRPAAEVRGSKTAWALATLVQPVGPVVYFALGRR